MSVFHDECALIMSVTVKSKMRLFCGKGDKAQKISAQRTFATRFNKIRAVERCNYFSLMLHIFLCSTKVIHFALVTDDCTKFNDCFGAEFYFICCCFNLKSIFFLSLLFTRQSIERIGLKREIAYGDKSMLWDIGTLLSRVLSLLMADLRTVSLIIFTIYFIVEEKRELCEVRKLTFCLILI